MKPDSKMPWTWKIGTIFLCATLGVVWSRTLVPTICNLLGLPLPSKLIHTLIGLALVAVVVTIGLLKMKSLWRKKNIPETFE